MQPFMHEGPTRYILCFTYMKHDGQMTECHEHNQEYRICYGIHMFEHHLKAAVLENTATAKGRQTAIRACITSISIQKQKCTFWNMLAALHIL